MVNGIEPSNRNKEEKQMQELLNKDQILSVVPQDFRKATKGRVVKVDENSFELEVKHSPEGILINNLIEFYSQTQNGVLYFATDIVGINGNVLTVASPIKHRFLQRRQFTRISFSQELELVSGDNRQKITTMDLSAGGMKMKSGQNIDIDSQYNVCIPLSEDQSIKCGLQPIRVEKQGEGFYTLSGRFQNLSNVDKMTLVQFCMKKKLENVNK